MEFTFHRVRRNKKRFSEFVNRFILDKCFQAKYKIEKMQIGIEPQWKKPEKSFAPGRFSNLWTHTFIATLEIRQRKLQNSCISTFGLMNIGNKWRWILLIRTKCCWKAEFLLLTRKKMCLQRHLTSFKMITLIAVFFRTNFTEKLLMSWFVYIKGI